MTLCAVVTVLAGCTAGPSPEAPPAGYDVAPLHREWMAVDLANTDSELVHAVLADFWVTDAERAAGREDYRTCMEQWPEDVTLTFDEDGGTSVGPMPSGTEEMQRFDDLTDRCSAAFGTIDLYYRELRANPQGYRYVEAVRACFEAEQVPDGEGLGDAQFEELIFGDGDTMYEPESQAGKDCMRQPFRGGD